MLCWSELWRRTRCGAFHRARTDFLRAYVIPLLLLFLALLPSLASAAPLAADVQRHALDATEVAYLRDRDGSLDIAHISSAAAQDSFQPLARGLDFGYTNDVIWLRFTLHRAVAAPALWWLEITSPFLDDVRFFAPRDNGFTETKAGDRFPFAARVPPYRHPIFVVELPESGTRQFYLRIASDSTFSASLVLWQPRALINAAQTELLLFGGLLGMLLVSSLFGVLNWWWSRERTLLVFAAVTAYMLLYVPLQMGYLTPWFFPNSPQIVDHAVPWSLALTTVCMLLIFRTPLQMLASYPRLHRLLGIAALLAMLAPISRGFGGYGSFGGPFLNALLMLSTVVLLSVSWQQWRRGVDGMVYFFAAGIVLLATFFFRPLAILGILPPSPELLNAWMPGIAALLFLSQAGVLMEVRAARRRQLDAEQDTLRLAALAQQDQDLREEQTQFFAFVAHELRTPLGAIRTGLANLERDISNSTSADDPVKARLGRLRRATEHMGGMIERNLQLQRLIDPGFVLQRLAESPLLPVVGAVAEVADAYPARVINRREDDDIPATLRIDPDLIELCLVNLLANAAKYSPATHPIGIETRVDADRQLLMYRVIDHGPGVPPEDVGRLFGLYPRHEVAPGRSNTFGIGLTLTARIAKLHGGWLNYRRESERTVFVLELPLTSSSAD
jgi:signal transduction histidine kinase